MMRKNAEEYLAVSIPDVITLIREMCAIPAPSNFESKRAEYCKQRFSEWNGEPIIDNALNVICEYNVKPNGPVTIFMAHTDTVFPDTEPMPFTEDDQRIYSPGVTDDTANLAVLMICARYVLKNRPATKCGLVFVANSGEEGLGNLKGSRAIVDRYGDRIQEFITLDGKAIDEIAVKSVGSHRYRVTVETEGGHSFGNFGNRNAIHNIASMIDLLYTIKVPVEGDSCTTYNVGVIQGGTSVNTIAQKAEMLYEYRSDSQKCLLTMKDMFEKVLEVYRAMGVKIGCEMVGDRPCVGNVDQTRFKALVERAADSVRKIVGCEPKMYSASTDCNIPLSRGIPAICLGVCRGGGLHTRGEWLDKGSLREGSRMFMDFLMKYVEAEGYSDDGINAACDESRID